MEFPTSLDMLVMIVKTKIHRYTCFGELKDAKYAASQDFTMSHGQTNKGIGTVISSSAEFHTWRKAIASCRPLYLCVKRD